jgi:hypothetical protein
MTHATPNDASLLYIYNQVGVIKEEKFQHTVLYGTHLDRCFYLSVREVDETCTCIIKNEMSVTMIEYKNKTELLFYVEIIFHRLLVIVGEG